MMILLAAAQAAGDESKQAQAMYEEGMKQYNVGEYRQALAAFKAGYFAKADAAFLFNMAQCFRMLGEAEPAIREYRAYLRARADAPNREAVERFVADLEQELRRKSANAPPLGVVAPSGPAASPAPVERAETVNTPPPVVAPPASVPAPALPPAPEKAVAEQASPSPAMAPPSAEPSTPVYRKGWFWGVMAGALAVAGGAVALSVAETTPANAMPTGDYAPIAVHF